MTGWSSRACIEPSSVYAHRYLKQFTPAYTITKFIQGISCNIHHIKFRVIYFWYSIQSN
jgi:hypothetical protein